jgi:exodeoxyribonuclease VII large subunit
MSRLSLFDLDRSEPTVFSVSELTARIKSALEEEFPNVTLRGEISNLSRPRSGHVYLNLKDDSASIRAVIWKSDAERIVFDLEDGLAVTARGKLTVYAPRGEYQLNIRRIEPEGVGPLELAFRQLVSRLAAEGLFDAARKKPLPRFPRRIIVVTSPTGAAIRDLLQVTSRRWPLGEILIVPAKVQGAGAAAEIANAIALGNRVTGADLMILARGGGSIEDLWAFNEEVVARAIVGSSVPVVSAVGHETDVTVADFVADHRALTPSEAGERCVPDIREVAQQLDRLGERVARAGRNRIDQARVRLAALADRAVRGVRRSLDDRRHRLAQLAASLEALSPLAVLARGYSLTFTEAGAPVRSPADVSPGDRLRTRLATGQIFSRVEPDRSAP